MRRLRFPIPLSLVLFLALTLAGGGVARRSILRRHLFSAMEANDEGSVLALLHSWPYPGNVAWQGGWTPLHWAAQMGSVEIARRLLDKGADVSATGLHWEVAKWFDETGDGDDFEYEPPLNVAAKNGRVEVVRLLIARGADVNGLTHLDSVSCRTALDWAATRGDEEMARVLLAAGAKVDGARNPYYSWPLFWAMSNAHAGVAQLLLDHGADRRAWGDEGPEIGERP